MRVLKKVELLLPFQIWNKKHEFIKQVFWLSLLQRVWVLRIHFSMICRNIMKIHEHAFKHHILKCISVYIMQNYDVSRNVVQWGLYLTPFCRKYGTVPWIQRLVIMIWTLPWMYPMISTQNFGGFLFAPWASKHLTSWWHQFFWHSTQPPVATCCAPQAHSITHKGGSWEPTARLGTFQCKSSCIRSGRGQTISGPDKKDKQSHWERHSLPKKNNRNTKGSVIMTMTHDEWQSSLQEWKSGVDKNSFAWPALGCRF